jgi:hypothetical protein
MKTQAVWGRPGILIITLDLSQSPATLYICYVCRGLVVSSENLSGYLRKTE